MNKYFIHKSGGLGDLIWAYLHTYQHLIEKIKKDEPDCHITFVTCSDNKQAYELLAGNPLIDEPVHLSMSDYHQQIWKKFTENKISLENHISHREPLPTQQFNLSTEEEKKYQLIKSMGEFVAIHPFGGTKDRTMVRKDFCLKTLFKSIIECGFTCCILGGNADQRKQNENKIDFNHEKCINLIDKHSCRLHAYITAQAKAFIGVSSCFSVVAALYKKPGLIYYPLSLKWWQQGTPPQVGIDGFSEAFRKANFKAEFFEKPSMTTKNLIRNFLNNN